MCQAMKAQQAWINSWNKSSVVHKLRLFSPDCMIWSLSSFKISVSFLLVLNFHVSFCFWYFRCLKYKNFEITERGEIEVKGKGKMHTYFLIRNKSATENEIMGRPMKDLDSGHESVQSVPEGKTETIPSSHQPGRVNLTHIFLLELMNINTIQLNVLLCSSFSYSDSAKEGPDPSCCNEVCWWPHRCTKQPQKKKSDESWRFNR